MAIETRRYRMQARAEAAEAATERILDAALELFWENPAREIVLAEVAARAGVSVHSVIRRFGGREGVEEAAVERAARRAIAQRAEAKPGDLAGAVANLIDHYEEMGEGVLAMLAAETRTPSLHERLERGRKFHADWCARVFAPAFAGRSGPDRRRLHAQLIAICDVQTWNLLRRVRGLSRQQSERALIEMLEPLLNGRNSS
jgi:AcrR family transcriptional regulator